MSKLSIVALIYKNAENIVPFYNEIYKSIVPYIDDYEIIMVNDDSPDDAWLIMTELAQKDSHIKLVRHSKNFGAYEALFTACRFATGDCITEKSVDLQEPSELLIEMYNKWKNGNKVVLGVRTSRTDGFISDMLSNMYYRIIRKVVNKDMPIGGYDIWLIDKKIAKHLVTFNERNSPLSLQILWLGYHPEKVYYARQERKIGKSSWNFSKKIKLFLDSLIMFSYVPVRFMSISGAVFFVCAILWSLVVAYDRIKGRIPVQGYTTLIILMLFSSGLIMFTLGILGEYIWRTLDATKKRPIAIVEETINCDEEGND